MRWHKPTECSFKINFDGSKLPSGEATADFIIRDHEGSTVACRGVRCGCISALAVEALALKEGDAKAKALGLTRITIEGDNLTIINCMRIQWSCPWEIEMLISDTLFLLQHFDGVQFNHVFLEINSTTDRVACLLHSVSSQDLLADMSLRVLIRNDALGWWSSRV